MQFIELSYLYFFSRGKWAIPKLWEVKSAEIKGSDLVLKKESIQKLAQRLLSESENPDKG